MLVIRLRSSFWGSGVSRRRQNLTNQDSGQARMTEERNLFMKKGFTLIELLVVISIIAILSLVGTAVFSGVQKSARDAKRIADLSAIKQSLEQYRTTNSTYILSTTFPCSAAGWADPFNHSLFGVTGITAGCPASILNALSNSFSGSIPQDPYCSGVNCSNSWSDYYLNVPSGGASFTIYAKLENTPSNPCTTLAPYNYCVYNQL